MNKQETDRIKDIFARALEVAPDERTAFIDSACAGDTALRQQVEGLLGSHSTAGTFMADPEFSPDDEATTLDPDIVLDDAGTRWIGDFRIEKELGQGGFGTVYLTEQRKPMRRRVALKVIKLGMDTKLVIARFEAEKQAMAMMDHPNIATIYDAGATASGRPYFVMEYVEGEKITAFCRRRTLPLAERIRLFIRVCAAVTHAHQRGVIHRDIKPSNILVAEEGEWQPKIIDFGIAKATSQRLPGTTLVSELRHFVGTPAYVSPEQADMSGGMNVDTRSDIYSLGVLLYELLTGSVPFDPKRLREAPYAEVQRIIREELPPKPSARLRSSGERLLDFAEDARSTPDELVRSLQGDLDWVVMKALEKDRERRYESAAALGRDLENYLEDRPVEAGPPDALYRMRKWVARNRLLATAACLLALAFATSVIGFLRASQNAREAANEAHKAAQALDLIDEMFLASGSPAAPQIRPLLDAFTADLTQQVERQPELAMTLLETVGRAYQRLGAFDEADRHLTRAFALAKARHGPDSAAATAIETSIGWLQRDRGDFQGAKAAVAHALRYQSEALGRGHETTLRSLAYLIDIERQIGNTGAAESLAAEWRSVLEAEKEAGRLSPSQVLSIRLASRSPHTSTPLTKLELARRTLSEAQSKAVEPSQLFQLVHAQVDAAIQAGRLEEAETAAQEAGALAHWR